MEPRQELALINQDIANAMVEATPDWWSFARLTLTHDNYPNEVVHTIDNPAYKSDCVVATDDLMHATRRLVQWFANHAELWEEAVYTVSQDEAGVWSYTVDFRYKTPG